MEGGDKLPYSSRSPTVETIRPIKFPPQTKTRKLLSTTATEEQPVTLFSLHDLRKFRHDKAASEQTKLSKRIRKSLNSLSEEEQLAIALKRSMEN
ncbi:hypothetical protein BASA81_005470 [Batrachochytrium salamandrivorans]|nr:hypothetical protein BASA81_005470 [Batrachochytrium salamandrivorans]